MHGRVADVELISALSEHNSISRIGAETKKEELVRDRYYELVKSNDKSGWFDGWYQYATHEPFEAVTFLMNEIVHKGRCIGCAACVEVCPVNVFDYVNERPVDSRHNGCVYCGLCAAVCPPAHLGSADLGELLIKGNDVKDEGFGRYRTAVLARSRDPEVLSRAQDGGIVSTLLIQSLEDGLIDGAILGDTVKGEPLRPVPQLATTREEILACASSRYTYSPNTVALRQAYEKDMRVAMVGVPCQVNGLRHTQLGPGEGFDFVQWFRKKVSFVVGLFCSEVFTYDGLVDLSKRINVPFSQIVNVNVKGKIITRKSDGTEVVSSLKEMRRYMRPACNYCWDYGAELSDIACGGIGLKGWTFTVTRTEKGQSLYEKMVENGLIEQRTLDQEPKSKQLLIKLSSDKRLRPKNFDP